MNNVQLMGRLVRDPDIRYSQNEEKPICVARLNLAVRRNYTSENGNADFINCVAFGKSGEFVEKYLHQGSKVICVGSILTGNYVNKDGVKVYTTEVNVKQFEFAESKAVYVANAEDILKRLSNKETVSIEEINSTSEMKMARSNIAHETPTSERENRKELREKIRDDMLELGSATIDDGGEVRYNGYVAKESRLDIIIGLPASGKSSAIVDTLSQEFKSRVIDNDEAKKKIPQFNNGWGAGVVHEESQLTSNAVYMKALKNHDNIILPKVVSDADKLISRYIADAKDNGYSVNVHYVELDRNISMGRMINRFIDDGRFLDPNLIEKYAPANGTNHIAQAYEQLKVHHFINGYSKWDNDVKKGEKPYLLESNGLDGDYIRNARAKGENENERDQIISSNIRIDGEIRDGRSNGSNIQETTQGILSKHNGWGDDGLSNTILPSKESGGIGRTDEENSTRDHSNGELILLNNLEEELKQKSVENKGLWDLSFRNNGNIKISSRGHFEEMDKLSLSKKPSEFIFAGKYRIRKEDYEGYRKKTIDDF